MPKRLIIFLLSLLSACHPSVSEDDLALDLFERQLNIETEQRIDAAYLQIQQECDSLMRVRVAALADSIKNIRNNP